MKHAIQMLPIVGVCINIVLAGELNFAPAINLGDSINTAGEERGSLSPDELTIFFHSESANPGWGDDIWQASRPAVDQPFGPRTSLGVPVNSANSEWGPFLSADGLSLYFGSFRNGGGDVFVATRSSLQEDFLSVSNVGTGVNTSYQELTPAVSADGLELFFRRYNHPSGLGRQDIWISTRATVADPFGAAANAGPMVNSVSDDGCPFLSADGLTLLFYSTRPGGFGGADLYACTREAVGEPFGPPRNLGPNINSSSGETYPYLTSSGLYFSSNRDGGIGDQDIYFAPFDSDRDGLPDTVETNTGTFISPTDTGTDPDNPDTDGDGLTDGPEVLTHGTNPLLVDTDGDDFNDQAEIQTGKDPLDPGDTPDAVVEFHTAVEFIFYSENGATYQIEWTSNLEDWTAFPEIITGNGNAITRFYSTRDQPKRFFRAEKLSDP